MDSQTRRYLIAILEKVDGIQRDFHILNYKFTNLENLIMSVRDDFNAGLAELGQAIVALANRIASLPTDVDALTQADVDALKADAASLANLAVANPDVPTDGDNTDAPAGPTD